MLAQKSLIGQWLPADKIMRTSRLGRLQAPLQTRLRPTIGQILPNRPPKQERILKHNPKPLPQLFAGEMP